jgi:hypothetical protein
VQKRKAKTFSIIAIVSLTDEEECEECAVVLEELENIDDEADMFGIDFVKINDAEAAKEYGIVNLPALVYFRKKLPLVYDGQFCFDKLINKLCPRVCITIFFLLL